MKTLVAAEAMVSSNILSRWNLLDVGNILEEWLAYIGKFQRSDELQVL